MFDNFISPQLDTFPLLRVKWTNYPKRRSIGDTLRLTHWECLILNLLIEEPDEIISAEAVTSSKPSLVPFGK